MSDQATDSDSSVDLILKHFKGAIRSLEICIQNTIEYTKQRQVFGKPVLDNQYVHFRLAELQTEVELLRSLLYRITAMVMKFFDLSYPF